MNKRTLIVALLVASIGAALAQTKADKPAAPAARPASTAIATFAGGCFWCTESDFDKVEGVISTTSGYIGGKTANPTYESVTAGNSGHAEAVQVVYDPSKVSYAKLVEYFWRTIDPTVKDRQFCDAGSSYRSAIFVHDEQQRAVADASKKALSNNKPFREPIVTEIVNATTFYPAEDYHQDYYLKNPVRYKFYRFNCGRDARLKQLWGGQAAQ
ncbi:MAG TPA: peptide-methionine (S)-S-oxide reductase MsrA [Burkholderiaceae bacterium]|nr:peptide-methionine (S)-S-oxide reductase MsrA [Burkholderiaceae bacterium]